MDTAFDDTAWKILDGKDMEPEEVATVLKEQ